MRILITGLLMFLAFGLFGQTVRTVGVVYTASAPVHTPSGQGAWIAVDTTSGSWYEWERTTGVWRDAGYRIQLTNTAGAPSYTPSKARGRVALSSDKKLYAYQAGVWDCLNCVTASDTATYLVQDSILVYYVNGIEFDRDTIPFVTLTKILQIVSDSLASLPDSLINGYGVTGYLPQYNTASTLDTTGLFWDGQLSTPGPIIFNFQSGNYNNAGSIERGSNGLGIRGINGGSGASLSFLNGNGSGIMGNPNGTRHLSMVSSGRLGIGMAALSTTPTARLHITGEGTTSSTTALLIENSAGTDGLKINDAGIVTIGSAANTASSVLDVQSTTLGFLPPRMTTAQRDAIASPADGLMLFCTDCTATDGSTGVSQTYSSSAWKNHY